MNPNAQIIGEPSLSCFRSKKESINRTLLNPESFEGRIENPMKLTTQRLSRLTVFLNDRTAFLILFAAVGGVKLALCALAPASFELRSLPAIGFSASPWVILENGIFEAWKMVTGSNSSYSAWASATPTAMDGYLRLLSVLLRLPAFICDILMSAGLYLTAIRITGSVQLGRVTSLAWFLNPFTLFAAELLAVPDVLVALLTLFSVLCLLCRRPILSSVLLACSIGLKLYPILLLPAFLIYIQTEFQTKRRYELCLLAGGTFGIVAYLSWLLQGAKLTVSDFTTYTAVSQPFGVLSIFSSHVPLSVAMAVVVAAYFLAYYYAADSSPTRTLIDTLIVVLLTYFALSDFYGQYFIWTLPFITLDFTLFNRRRFGISLGLLLFLFGTWLLASGAFATPSGYSLLLIQLEGSAIPSYSVALQKFLQDAVTQYVVFPVMADVMYAFALVYLLSIVKHWNWGRRVRKNNR
jgi:hypothetical protein